MKSATPSPVRNILMATDFSEGSEKAFKYAQAVAAYYGAEMYVAHVVGSGVFPVLPAQEREKLLAEAREAMSRFVPSGRDSSRCHSVIEGGEPADVLRNFARQKSIDLLVLGTSGRKGLKRFVLGSVAEEIFREMLCPVLTVGPHTSDTVPEPPRLHRVLFVTDLTPASLEALPCAVRLARDHHATLALLHVVKSHADETAGQAALANLTPAGMDLRVRTGLPAETVVKFAREEKVDLMVLGVRSGGTWERAATHLPGPVAYNIIAQAPCPVLTVRSMRPPAGAFVSCAGFAQRASVSFSAAPARSPLNRWA